ncbi:response regulator [Campylobacter sp. 9BO]|uniref:response regulator transcription factor n=1 Tax=Campylobacter sp. 9BO TaxID=3424759 RepID=UPI003D32B421
MARQAIYDGLEPYCKQVCLANDGVDGVEKFNKINPDIILTDIHMPLMNGFDMMKDIHKIKPHQKFIVFTSYDTDNNLLKSVKAGATLFFKKPIDINQLRQALIVLTYKNEENFINLGNNIYADLKKEKIFKGTNEIYLTFLQNKLFWLFAYNASNIITYGMIEEFVYENEPVSKSTIQKSISRLKNELGISIKNIQDAGYMLSIGD